MNKIKFAAVWGLNWLFLMLPEIIYGLIDKHFQLCWLPDKLAVVGLLALILTLTPHGRFKCGFVAFWGVCCVAQFCYMKYFGSYLTPYAINFIFWEFGDVALEAKFVWAQYLWVIAMVALPLIGLLWLSKKLRNKSAVFRYYPVLYLGFFGYFFYLATTPEGIFQMLFKNTCYASYNTINSFSAFFGNVLPQQVLAPEAESFEPYTVRKNSEDLSRGRNIIMVVGESTNADNMSLLGYDKDTTPKLQAYARNDVNFVAKKAWAAAVNTLIALPMLYNIQYHPQDYKKLVKKDSNLLHFAKENGFRVVYIELQNDAVFRKTGVDKYDELYIYNQEKDKHFKNEYEYLAAVLPKLSLEGRNFIIIHQRTVHSPYVFNYIGMEDIATLQNADNQRLGDYDNAMRFEDAVLDMILKFAKSSREETYFYYVSDHGEALGQNGLWGHGHLDAADLKVPVLFTMFNSYDKAYRQKIARADKLCAYQVSLWVAEKLGFDVTIPDEQNDYCIVNGRDSMGRAGILQIDKNNGSTKLIKAE